ncbi:MAG TPA: FAD-binding oxidoreductase [Deinococcales bacterium]|nr:FAD-binding oxidoreductase [Deinococcales bacterium]
MATLTSRKILNAEAIEELRAALLGTVVLPSDAGYDAARSVMNGMIDKRPAAIVRVEDVADVVTTVNFGRSFGALVAVRGGGHSGGGLGTCDDGLVIDLSRLKGVRVNPESREVRVEGGATWHDVDHATHAFGLAVPGGTVSSTGVGGLTLGGGSGHLTRKYGLTIDNLLEADVVLADGKLVTASDRENPDLFWAIRGGGGNFGIVTSFLFQAHPVSTVVAGPTIYPLERAADVMRWFRDFLPKAPEELNGFLAFLTIPPAPVFPASLHLKKVAAIVWCYAGDLERAEEALRPVREFGPPLLDGLQAMPFPALQGMFDALFAKGQQSYWRAEFWADLTDAAIPVHERFAQAMPTMLSTTHFYPLYGAPARVSNDETAWGRREARYSQAIVGMDPDPASAGAIRDWCVAYSEALKPYALGGGYLNFEMEQVPDKVRASYGPNFERLQAVKRKYDPGNFFRVNQNIRP